MKKRIEHRKCNNCGGEEFDITENIVTKKIYLNCSECYDNVYVFPKEDRNKLATDVDVEPVLN